MHNCRNSSPERLATELGTTLNHLKYLCNNVRRFYRQWKQVKRHSDGTPKMNGDTPDYREITESRGELKKIQSRIKTRLLDKIPLPNAIQGGIKGCDNISNASVHKGKKHHFLTDIRRYYPSISHHQVYRMFVRNEFSPDVSRFLTRLNTLNGHVPQGIPTGTHIANLVFVPVDERLMALCQQHGIMYSRYVDDLVFSTQLAFSTEKDFKTITLEIVQIIREARFLINHRKTYLKIGPVEVTGVVTRNNILEAPEEKLDDLKKLDSSSDSYAGLLNYIERVREG